ncbi:MAG: VOC family protein, partial [Mesorhizobium sp.]
MLDHISLGVGDTTVSKRFYDALLQPLGYGCLSQSPGSLGYGANAVALWVNEAARPVPADTESGLHFCFAAPTRKSVDAFHAAALREG